ncbi:MAG TPA: phosphoribosyl-ATP pyrophosphohydrolase [Caulobacteraceae bacterium]|nr:phosphoribosyl-ATP pyrophosphohydrolase [Caulobacteraceae bacterium]
MSGPLEALTARVAQVGDLYAARFGVRRDDDWFLLKLQEELGELTQAHLRLSERGRGDSSETQRGDEAADLLCMLLLYCRRYGIDLDAAVSRKWLSHLETAE